MRRLARFWLASVVLGTGSAMSASPAPGPSLPVLPGSVVKRVQSKASLRGLSAAEPPLPVRQCNCRTNLTADS